jgi:hypothetical protein
MLEQHEHVYCYVCGWAGCAFHGGHVSPAAGSHCPACCDAVGDTVRLIRVAAQVSVLVWRPVTAVEILQKPRNLAAPEWRN